MNLLYPLVNEHSNEIRPSSIGKSSSKGLLTIAMLVHKGVTQVKFIPVLEHFDGAGVSIFG